jgi:hypothetical protein
MKTFIVTRLSLIISSIFRVQICIHSELYILHVAISLEGACDLVTYIAWISLINSKLGFMICISIALLEAVKFQKNIYYFVEQQCFPKF